jgi:hypothetical protein
MRALLLKIWVRYQTKSLLKMTNRMLVEETTRYHFLMFITIWFPLCSIQSSEKLCSLLSPYCAAKAITGNVLMYWLKFKTWSVDHPIRKVQYRDFRYA